MAGTAQMAGAPAAWRIVSQQEGTRPNSQGVYVPGVLITFQLGSGQTGSVFVPEAQYNPATVKGLVEARAKMMAEVAALQG